MIGITSKPDSLDPALCRPGRFETEIETGVPTAPDRFQVHEKKNEKKNHIALG